MPVYRNQNFNYEYTVDEREIRRTVGSAEITCYKGCDLNKPCVLYGKRGHDYTCCNLDEFEDRGPEYSRSIMGTISLDEIFRTAPRGQVYLYNE